MFLCRQALGDSMRLSLVDDYEDQADEMSSLSVDSELPPPKEKQNSGSYTNLFDTSQPTPVGASLNPSPQPARPRHLYDRSPRTKPYRHPDRPPLATPEDSSTGTPMVHGNKPITNSLDFDRSKQPHSRPPPGARGPYTRVSPPRSNNTADGPYTRVSPPRSKNTAAGQYPHQKLMNNGYPVRSLSEERFRDNANSAPVTHNTRGNYPEQRTRNSYDQLHKDQGNHGYQTGTGASRTLPSQNRYVTEPNFENSIPDDRGDGGLRPMSFVKALEMSEIVKTKEKDHQFKRKDEEKKKSVYDSAYEISV